MANTLDDIIKDVFTVNINRTKNAGSPPVGSFKLQVLGQFYVLEVLAEQVVIDTTRDVLRPLLLKHDFEQQLVNAITLNTTLDSAVSFIHTAVVFGGVNPSDEDHLTLAINKEAAKFAGSFTALSVPRRTTVVTNVANKFMNRRLKALPAKHRHALDKLNAAIRQPGDLTKKERKELFQIAKSTGSSEEAARAVMRLLSGRKALKS